MQRSTAFTAVAALGLTVVAGLSAAAVTIGQGATAAPPAAVTQYVDQFGNPVDPPGTATSTSSSPPARSTVAVRPAPSPSGGEHEEEDED